MEDSNYFLKSIGLDNYIGHEKTFCDPLARMDMDNLSYETFPATKADENSKNNKELKNENIEKQDVSSDVVNQITDNVQADDFFSSLELQSSSKTSSNMISLGLSNKSLGGIVTRSRSFSTTLLENSKVSRKILSKLKTKGNLKQKAKKSKEKLKKVYEKGRKFKKGKNRKLGSKKTCQEGKEKVSVSSESKKLTSSKEENVLEKSSGLEKNKEEDDWTLFNSLGPKKEMDEKIFDSKQSICNDLPNSGRRCTPELFSMNSILMSDAISEGKDDVDKLLEVEDYDDSFLEEMYEFSYGPPRSHTGGKWKPGSLAIRTSPMLWQNQTWDSLFDRNHEEEGKIRAETPVDTSIDFSTDKINKYTSVATSGGKWKSFAPPSTYTGGKWKPLTPPASYTGGKWKPSDVLQRPKKSEEVLSPDDSDNTWKCESQPGNEPPSAHTGGKWKPSSSLNISSERWKSETLTTKTKEVPPYTHTRGKWVSESGKNSVNRSTLRVIANCQSTSGKFLKTAGGMIQYYCSPCNRRLSSKKMFKKHVQSELHFKRVLQENELEFDSRSLKLFHGLFTQEGYRERGLGKRIIKKPEMFKDTDSGMMKRDRKVLNSIRVKRKRLTRREIRCDVCKIKVPNHQLGKHLVSYYHSRRIQLKDPQQQKLILDNIHTIVKQAPYQCGICRFYCNTHMLFKKHWSLNVHTELEQNRNKRFWCSLCSFECETSRLMELHLDSNSHREVILAVNKSIPIIIRQKVIFNCSICLKEFRFNRELIRHKKIFHKIEEVDRSNKFNCSVCNLSCKSLKSLQRHILNSHKDQAEVPYFCSTCNQFFSSAAEAKSHRNDVVHKYKKADSEGKTGCKDLTRSCSFCEETLEDVAKLKSHLFDKHPDFLPKCIKCGMVFALSQEVSRHVKNNECRYDQKSSSESFNCDSCLFSTNSKAEFLLHTVTHQTKSKDEEKIQCPLCGSPFTQTALGVHLKSHLKEMTYQCTLCSKAFVRKDRYTAHLKSKHFDKKDSERFEEEDAKKAKESKPVQKKEAKVHKETDKKVENVPKEKKGEKTVCRRQLCGDPRCKYVAKDLNDLETHSLVHIGPKMYQCPDCPYYAKTNTTIKRHYLVHVDERSFPCPHCPFKAKLKSHLNRHLRLHTGAKPFKCPHCSFSCNILENLRKHVLYTRIHPGKKLYECKLCSFDTNVSKDFKTHLAENHKNEFKPSDTNVAAGIYNKDEDFDEVVDGLPKKVKTSSKLQKKPESCLLKKKINVIVQNWCPIAPKPVEKKISPNSKITSNSVEDKRKVLEMELQKLRKQINPESKKSLRSYPSPAEKDKMRAFKTEKSKTEIDANKKDRISVKDAPSPPGEDGNGVVFVNGVPSEASPKESPAKAAKAKETAVQQVDPSPAYVLYEHVFPSEDMELYLLEDYQV